MFNGDGESFKNYYSQLSSGRYTAINTVTDWVKVPGNASTYGDNAVEDEGGSWSFIDDSADSWYASQLAAGLSAAEIDDYLSQFDVWDRYDFDSDGDFNEADGYIDHFQAVHAGEGEEAGADEDAIWSHRWYVGTGYGTAGPSVGGVNNLGGGARSVGPSTSSVTTPSSPRTVAWASSPTSSATTSACPTSTTPRVARTARRSGR